MLRDPDKLRSLCKACATRYPEEPRGEPTRDSDQFQVEFLPNYGEEEPEQSTDHQRKVVNAVLLCWQL